MNKRLIILLTDSPNDRGILAHKPNWPKQDVVFIECDKGQTSSIEPLADAERLLCVIRLYAEKIGFNTGTVRKVLEKCSSCEVVVATHTGVNKPESILNVMELKLAFPVANYTTADQQLIQDWCIELVNDSPDPAKVHEGFDAMFRKFSDKASSLGPVKEAKDAKEHWQLLRHDLVGLIRPPELDLQGWQGSGFSDRYFEIGKLIPFQPEKIRALIYRHQDSKEFMTVSELVEVLGNSSSDPATQDELQMHWSKIKQLFPESDSPNANPQYKTATDLLKRFYSADHSESEKDALQIATVRQWLSSLRTELSAVWAICANEMPLES